MEKIVLPQQVQFALNRLGQAGYEAYIVGGCVRDSIMGLIPTDWDIATNALPHETAALFADCRVIPTGMQHGTVTVMVDHMPLEMTTYRIDGDYSDSRHPDKVRFTASLQEDLARRDFTINAIAYHPNKGIADPFEGQADLQKQLIRCVGDPGRRFAEDALRIMRGVRFSSVLGFSIEQTTWAAMIQRRRQLQHVAAERLHMELTKLLCGKDVFRVLMDASPILFELLPELVPMWKFDQNNPYHLYDVYEHTAHSVAQAVPVPSIRLAMLFHDTGKPACYTQDNQGIGHFYGHPKVSANIAQTALRRLRFDSATIHEVVALVTYHDLPIEPSPVVVKRWLNRLSPALFFQLLEVKAADGRAQNPAKSRRYSCALELKEMAQQIIVQQQCFARKDLAVNGRDLMALGIEPGQRLGMLLDMLLEAVITDRCPNQPDSLLALAARYIQQDETPAEGLPQ